MPSSYSVSGRFTLQATGEGNNTWGVILNNGVFKMVDDAIFGRLGFALSTTKVLTTALGAPDEARMAFLDVTGGTGGAVVIPPVPKGYFVRNAAAGNVSITTGSPGPATFRPGDAGPVFSDGGAVYPLMLSGLGLHEFIIAAIGSATVNLPPTIGQLGKALMVRDVAGMETWIPSRIEAVDILEYDLTRAFYGDLF